MQIYSLIKISKNNLFGNVPVIKPALRFYYSVHLFVMLFFLCSFWLAAHLLFFAIIL